MFKSVTENYLLILLGIFTLPYLAWRLGRTDKYAPLVVVQIVMGIIFGPGIFGRYFPDTYAHIFSTDTVRMMSGVATWAVVLFVSTAGLEINLRSARDNFKETATTASFALFTPLVIGLPLVIFLSFNNRWIGETAEQWQFSLATGMALSVTALPILILLLEKMHILKHDIGIRCMRYASFDDVAIWTVFAIIMLEWHRVARQGVFLLIYVLVALLIRKYSHRLPQQDRMPMFLAWVVLCALVADWSGLHYIVGGFLAGLVVDEEWIGEEVLTQFRKYILMLIMPVFFLSTGLRTDWELGNPIVIALAVILFAVQAFGKITGIRLAALVNGWSKSEATTIGWLLQTKALIEIIFCTIMLDKGIISGQMFTALLFMAIFSTIATTPIVSKRLQKRP